MSKDRSDNRLWEIIKQTGADLDLVGDLIYDLCSGYKDNGWDAERLALATEMYEMATKMQLNEVFMTSDITALQERINQFFRKKTKNLCANDIVLLDELPKRRYDIKAFVDYSKATMGLGVGFHLIGAEDNVGKTAILIQLACDILFNNTKSRVWYFTLDDTGKKLSKRFLACLTYYLGDMKMHTTSLINFANSKYDSWDKTQGDAIYEKKLKAHAFMQKLLIEKRLFVIGGEHTEESIKNEMVDCDPKNDILIIDAVYNVGVSSTKNAGDMSLDGIRARVPKKLSNHFRIPVVCTKDARKASTTGKDIDKDGTRIKRKLGTEDLSGSGRWKHEPDTVAMMWEEKVETGTSNGKPPVISKLAVMSLTKNKMDSFSPVIRYLFNGAKNVFREVEEKYKNGDHDL